MPSVLSKIGFGLLGGAAGLLAMEVIKRITAPLAKKGDPRPHDRPMSQRTMSPLGPQHTPEEGATDAVGRIGYEKATGREPSRATKSKLSWGVHIGYGLLVAALYGAARGERSRSLLHTLGEGAAYGAGLWLLGDELAVPLLGLSDRPTSYPAARHAQSLAMHLGFGIATAATTRALAPKSGWWN